MSQPLELPKPQELSKLAMLNRSGSPKAQHTGVNGAPVSDLDELDTLQ